MKKRFEKFKFVFLFMFFYFILILVKIGIERIGIEIGNVRRRNKRKMNEC